MEYEKQKHVEASMHPSAPYESSQYPPPYPGGYNNPPPPGTYPFSPGAQTYPPPTGYANPEHGFGYPQHGQQVVVVGPAQPVILSPVPYNYVPMTGAIVLSCFVFWCCGMLLGGIAFILAVVGEHSSSRGDTAGAIRLRNASYGVSGAAIVVGIIIIVIFFVVVRH